MLAAGGGVREITELGMLIRRARAARRVAAAAAASPNESAKPGLP